MTWVLPVPAPATTSSGPSPWVTARSWSGFRPPSSASSPPGRPATRRVHDRHELAPGRQLVEGMRLAPRRADARPRHGRVRLGVGWSCRGGHVGSIGGRRDSLPVRPSPADGRGLLVGQRRVRRGRRDRLRVDARAGPGVEARQDPAVAAGVEQRQGEALVAAGLLERVVADQPDPLEARRWAASSAAVRAVRSSSSRATAVDLVEVGVEDRLEAPPPAARQAAQPGVEPPRPPGQGDDGDEQRRRRRRTRPTTSGAEYGWTSASRSIRGSSAGVGPSLAGRPHRGRVRRDAILCRRQTAACASARPHPTLVRWRPSTDHGQARPRQHDQTRTAPTPPAHGSPAATRPTATAAPLAARAAARRPDRRRRGARRRARSRDRGRGARPRTTKDRAARDPSDESRGRVVEPAPSRPPTNTRTSRATCVGSPSSAARWSSSCIGHCGSLAAHPERAASDPAPDSTRTRPRPRALPSRPCHPPDGRPAPDPNRCSSHRPSASRWRPGCARATLDEFVGQEHLVGERGPLRRSVARGHLASILLWGPPGTGKTSLARLLADAIGAEFATLSAVMAGVAEVRATIAEAQDRLDAARHPDRPVPRRDPPLQQGPAGRAAAPRRGRHGHAHRRDDREPLLRGQRRAPVADARLASRAADRRGGRRASSVARSTDEERGLAGPLGPDGGVALTDDAFEHLVVARRRRRARGAQRARGRDRAGRVRGRPRRRRPRQPAARGRRGRRPAARPRLRPRRRRPLRHRLGVHQEPARQRPGRGALLAGGDDRGRRGPAVHRSPADHQRVRGRRQRRSAGAVRSRSRRARRSTGSGCPRRSTRSPRRPPTSPPRPSRTAPARPTGRRCPMSRRTARCPSRSTCATPPTAG